MGAPGPGCTDRPLKLLMFAPRLRLRRKKRRTVSGTSRARRCAHDQDDAQGIAAMIGHGAPSINDASGVRTKAAPGGQERLKSGMSEGGIDAGEPGEREPPRRLMRATVAAEPRAVVRSTLPKARAEVSALWGHWCTAECGAWCTAKPAPAMREVRWLLSGTVTGVSARRVRLSGKRSAQGAQRPEARGIPARRVETAQRARQGSPVAKRRAQTLRTHHHLRHRHHRQHQHHRSPSSDFSVELPRFGGRLRAVAPSTGVNDSRWKEISLGDRS